MVGLIVSGMNKQIIIQRKINAINHLPEAKAKAISDFTDLILNKYEDQLLAKGLTISLKQ